MKPSTRIAILTHSTNPRGGVVHALELGDALTRLGHAATVFAPDAAGTGFFRPTLCRTSCVEASPVGRNVRVMVETRVADYLRHFESAEPSRFDVWHAQDGISANALATLKERGRIRGFARTVHHVDIFDDERLNGLQLRGIRAPDHLFTVSRVWHEWLAVEHGLNACRVGNGVDTGRFSPAPDETDSELRARLALPPGAPLFLAVGGVEERKNTIRILQAWLKLRSKAPLARLLIVGGASLLEHGDYQARFVDTLAQSGTAAEAIIRTGPWPQKLMPALYRAATALIFPSTREGFGLVVLEAMASGLPVVTSRIAPFTEYLREDDVVWCDPLDIDSIATAMALSLDVTRHPQRIARGLQIAARHGWDNVARAHLATYEKLQEPVHA
jgi:glycosyltransferase-like protein